MPVIPVTVTPVIRPGVAGPVICRPIIAPVTVAVVGITVAIPVGIATRLPGILSDTVRQTDSDLTPRPHR